MFIEKPLIIFIVVFIYWLGCKRTQIKYEFLSLMTPEKYRSFTEVKLIIAKVMIILLIFVVFLQKHNG